VFNVNTHFDSFARVKIMLEDVEGLTKGSCGDRLSSLRRNVIMAMNRCEAVILNRGCFRMGADPIALNLTITFLYIDRID
jgi:acyl-CoA synthetase (AMP-forming)/AMP-acid ligase II